MTRVKSMSSSILHCSEEEADISEAEQQPNNPNYLNHSVQELDRSADGSMLPQVDHKETRHAKIFEDDLKITKRTELFLVNVKCHTQETPCHKFVEKKNKINHQQNCRYQPRQLGVGPVTDRLTVTSGNRHIQVV